MNFHDDAERQHYDDMHEDENDPTLAEQEYEAYAEWLSEQEYRRALDSFARNLREAL